MYLLRMSSGFDLYLANQLTQAGALTVVTDPAQAQYVLTDTVGSNFEATMDALYKPKEEPPAAPTDGAEAKGAENAKGGTRSMIDAYTGAAPRLSSFSRGQGNVFLVSRESSAVVWSTFLDRRDQRSEKLNKAAAEVVKRLQKYMKEGMEATPSAP